MQLFKKGQDLFDDFLEQTNKGGKGESTKGGKGK